MMRRAAAIVLLLVELAPTAGAAQKPALTPQDYGRFEFSGDVRLSPDGRHIVQEIRRVNDTLELRLRALASDSVVAMPWGREPTFSANSRWLAYTLDVSADERRRLERERKPVRRAAALRHMATGVERRFPQVEQRAFDATGRFFAVRGPYPEQPRGRGADLLVVDLVGGTEFTIGNVRDFAWSQAGSQLAVTIETGAARGNGVQVHDLATGRLVALDAGGATYRQLAWRRGASDLAVLKSLDSAGGRRPGYSAIAWRGVATRPERHEWTPAASPDSLVVSDGRAPEWSDDGRRLLVGVRAARDLAPADSAAASDTISSVQVWHTRDVRLMAAQRVRAAADARRTLLVSWTVGTPAAVAVSSDYMEDAVVPARGRFGVERVRAPYPTGTMFGRPFMDVYAVDLSTGARRRVVEKVRFVWESPEGGHVVWFDGRDYWSEELATARRRNLTSALGVTFADTTDDHPTDVAPPWGVGGWTPGDGAVFLHDAFDVWQVPLDGTPAVRLTDGRRDEVRHRVVALDRERQRVDPSRPVYFALHGVRTQQRGYARKRPGAPVERLLLVDRFASGLRKADSAEVYAYSLEARDLPPVWHAGDATLRSAPAVLATNPFASDYAWGRTELVSYRNAEGMELQGVLLYPANHDPSQRYPMIVYTYERLSDQAHFFEVPSEKDYYSFVTWTQRGYFVLLPDIVFRARDPGVSLVETLTAAVGVVRDRGLIDASRVGLIGHSWGGYNATFVPTRSRLFAASVAGAPLTDFVSFMGQIHWNQGNAEVDHWETGQARMAVPYWEDPEAHHRNSPVHKVHEMETPLLMAHGDKDGTVEFFQATEFFNFARRAQRSMVLLVYEGENHAFTRPANQVDYHRRILEWFGHYLKGEPAPAWIREGVPWQRLPAERRRVAEGKEAAPQPPAPHHER